MLWRWGAWRWGGEERAEARVGLRDLIGGFADLLVHREDLAELERLRRTRQVRPGLDGYTKVRSASPLGGCGCIEFEGGAVAQLAAGAHDRTRQPRHELVWMAAAPRGWRSAERAAVGILKSGHAAGLAEGVLAVREEVRVAQRLQADCAPHLALEGVDRPRERRLRLGTATRQHGGASEDSSRS